MSPLAALLPVWSGVLVLAGLAKLRRPVETARALAGRRLSEGFWRPAVRAGAAAETAVGAWSLIGGGAGAAGLVAASYAAFAFYVGSALTTRRPLSTCGCLGEPDTPPTWGHLGLCAAAAGTAGLAAGGGWSSGLGTVLGSAGGAAPAYLALVVAAVYGTVLVLGAGPRLVAVRRADR